MKKALIYWYTFLLLLVLMTSCKSQKPIVIEKKVTEKVVEKVRDTVLIVVPDSSNYKALLECQNGKIKIKDVLEQKKGSKNLKKPKVSIDDKGILSVDCQTEITELRAKLKDKQTIKETVIEVPVLVPAEITGWVWFQIWMGRIFLFLLIGLLIGFLAKKFIKG